MDEQHLVSPESGDSLEYTVRRVLHLLRRRIGLFVACAVIALTVGYVRHRQTVPEYRASGAVMVQHSSPSSAQMQTPLERELQGYSQLFTSDAVVSAALAKMEELPPELKKVKDDEYLPSKLASILKVAPRKSSNVIDLSCTSREPESCVDVINSVVDASLEVFGETQKNHAFELVKTLDEERRILEEELEKLELGLLAAKRDSGDFGLTQGDPSDHPLVKRAMTMNELLIATRQSRIEQEALLAQVESTIQLRGDLLQHISSFEQLLGRQFEVSPLAMTKRESVDVLEIEKLVRDKQQKLAELDRSYGPSHPRHAAAVRELQDAQRQLTRVKSTIHSGFHDPQMGARLASILTSSIKNERQKELALEEQYEAAQNDALELNAKQAKVAMIERELGLRRDQHQNLLSRIADVDINLDRASIQFLVVSDPTVPKMPINANLSKTAMTHLFLGLMVAAGITWFLDLLQGRFDSMEDLERELGQAPTAVVGLMPVSSGSGWNSVHAVESPKSIYSESVRTLRASLGFSAKETGCLAVTSSEPGDGKTTVLSNLAASFAQSNARCLLIDADLRKPGLSKLLGMRGKPGLSDVLRSEDSISDAVEDRIYASEESGVDFLPCGMRVLDPSAIFAGPRMEELLGWATSHYDQILIDCPPALIASDALIVGRVVDSMLVVIRPEKNKRKVTRRTMDLLNSSGIQVAGYVLNGANNSFDKALYGYGGGYYAKQYADDGDVDEVASPKLDTDVVEYDTKEDTSQEDSGEFSEVLPFPSTADNKGNKGYGSRAA